MKFIINILNLAVCYTTLNVVHNIGTEHEKIVHWWKTVSERKPLKCQISSEYLESLHPITTSLTKSWEVKLIDSRVCNEEDTTHFIHYFKGKTLDNKIQGLILKIQ